MFEKLKEKLLGQKSTAENLDNSTKEASNLHDLMSQRMVGGWRTQFVEDVYNEAVLDPHDEMFRAKKAYLYCSFIEAAVKSLNDLVVGGEIRINAKSDKLTKELNGMFEETDLKDIAMEDMFPDWVKAGNFYAKRVYGQKKEIVTYKHFKKPERVYHDLDSKDIIKRFIQEIPHYQPGDAAQQYSIRYYGNVKKSLYGHEIKPEDMFYSKIGTGTITSYGRGALAHIINDYAILTELERAMAILARYKAIPKKLIQLTNSKNKGDARYLSSQLKQLSDTENPIIPFETKVDDLSYGGKELNLQPMIDYLKKKITVNLAPSFMIHGEETRYANSKEQRTTIQLRIKAIRARLESDLKKELINIAKSKGKKGLKQEDFSIEFGEYDLGEGDEERKATINLWNAGLITLGEARQRLGLEEMPEEAEDLEDMFSFDVKGKSGGGNPDPNEPE